MCVFAGSTFSAKQPELARYDLHVDVRAMFHAMSKPIVETVCMGSSYESWEP